MTRHKQNQHGAVSIFVVVFSALFVTIITVSFVGLMIRGQQQATNADLSNSAYDAALAGVEDGKRLLLQYRQCLRGSIPAPTDCARVVNAFAAPACNMVKRGLTGDTSDDETLIQSASETGPASNSKSLDQAYTCVQIDYMADEKEVTVADEGSVLVPIDANGEMYNTVNVSWFTKDQGATGSLDLPGGATELPQRQDWSASGRRPPILRTQWIQHGAAFTPSDFDSDTLDGKANVKTAFLYPSVAGYSQASPLSSALMDSRPVADPGVKGPTPVVCTETGYQTEYACSVNITLPDPINLGSRTGYLQLGALYGSTAVRIKLLNSGNPVDMVAPTIDSTGRANDLFRRVKVGVSFNGQYPQAAFDVNGNLCKDFSVTNDSFEEGGCNPNNP